MPEQILVAFEGEGSGTGELTWGQQDIWRSMQYERASHGIGGVRPLPAGTTVDDVAGQLRFIVERNQSLRTRLAFAGDGRPLQVLASSGQVPLEIVETGDADPAEVADGLYQPYHEQVFDYARDWPIRWAVVQQHGVPTHLAGVVCHIAADGQAIAVLLADLASRDPASGLASGPVTGVQPLELARQQRSPSGQHQSDAALRYWERHLRTIPARRFRSSADARQPRYWQAIYTSPTTDIAARMIAARTGAGTSAVLLAAFAMTLARLTGINPVVVQIVVNNRFRPGLADAVSPISQGGLCVIDVTGNTFDEVVARARQAVLRASKNAYYDPVRWQELIAAVSSERGEQIDLSCCVNDRRALAGQVDAGRPPTASDLRAALLSRLTWGYQRDRPSQRLFLHLNGVPEANYELCADTHFVSPTDMEECLRQMESVTVSAALGGAALGSGALTGAPA